MPNLLETKADISIVGEGDEQIVAIKICGGVTIYTGGRIDGSTFAQRELLNGDFEDMYFPLDMSLADIIRAAAEWALPF